ncbi:MAG TPA: FAD-dependent monooxygenase [Vicinamibacterales bacterium]|nr:FAD-dependent monooxygenase [Vicinamibacterales bacterium]
MTTTEVIVIGAGPAGSAAARLLAAWGHRVLVVDRGASEARSLAESIPPSAQKVLGALGMLAAIEDAGLWPWRGNTVWWGDDAPRVEPFPPAVSGYQVVRADFDRRLRALAADAGATFETGLVRDAAIVDEPGSNPTSITIERDGAAHLREARLLIDCSGRAGVIARRRLRRAEGRARTVALAGVWRAASAWPFDPTHTLVSSYDDGWAWSVPVAADTRYVTVMVDPERTALARGVAAADVYAAELAKVAPFRSLIAGAVLADGPFGADASPYHADRYAGPGFLVAGDAGSFIDPLSSFGVKKALASGWLAAIAAHTALTRPAMGDVAFTFFDRRERRMAAAADRQAAVFARSAASAGRHPFWGARAIANDDGPDQEVDVASLATAPDVLAAFQELRRRSSIQLRPAPDMRIEPRAAVRGREIVLDDHVVTPAWPDGVRYLRNIDLVAVVRAAPHHADVGDLYGAILAAQPGIGMPDFLGALSSLIARGALAHIS